LWREVIDSWIRKFRAKLSTGQKITGILSLGGALVLFILAAFPGVFTSHDPVLQDLSKILNSPDALHPLGLDGLGRDVWSRIVYGARHSLFIGVSVSLSTLCIPLCFSSFILFSGKWMDQAYLAVLDLFLVFPPLLLAILIAARNPEGAIIDIVLALTLSGWASNGRLIRSYLLELKSREFVTAAQALGASNTRIYWKHLLPNLISPLVILATFRVGTMVLAESTLSFLGLGGGPETISWGWLVFEGKAYISQSWLLSLAPATAIALCVFSFQGLGETMEALFLQKKGSAR